ncbi:MAG: sigma-70 family RNA polymerase sigma factor [Acidobacteria bacterium]|nr:sigma-70 family RNA polymerase sigma factor [Acidobacteriota bacterium]
MIKFGWTTPARNPAAGYTSYPVNGALEPTPDLRPEETLEELVKRIRFRLKTILRSFDIPFQDAEDLLQDSFLEAFRKWESIYDKESWLLGTLRVKCWNYRKKRRLHPSPVLGVPSLEELCPPQPPPQEKRDEALDLQTLLGVLDPRHQQVLWLRFGMGFTPHEVAERLGYCHSSVRKLTLRAVARLRNWHFAARPRPPRDEVPDPDLD